MKKTFFLTGFTIGLFATISGIILGIILIIYILGDYQTPPALAPYLTNITSYAIMITLFVIAIFNTNLIELYG